MEVLIAAVVLLPLLVLMNCVLKRKRQPESGEGKNSALLFLLCFDIMVIVSGFLVEGSTGPRLLFDLALAVVPAVIAVFQVFETMNMKYVVIGFGILSIVISLLHILCAVGIVPPASSAALVCFSAVIIFSLSFVVALMTILRLRNLQLMMKSCSVWSCVWLYADFIYMTAISAAVMLILILGDVILGHQSIYVSLADMFIGMALAGLYLRKLRNSPFVIMQKYEKVILESIRMSHFESITSTEADDSLYKDVYERVTEYFEAEKPFLRGDLSINDLVQVIYSNKLYISRAISLFTGKNFKQFVNSYRVKYSCDFYRENPQLKIVELAQACGFNTVASYNMAFRLFMNETPGEWCRKERVKMAKSVEEK